MGADEKLGARKTWPTFTWRGAPLLLCEGLVRGDHAQRSQHGRLAHSLRRKCGAWDLVAAVEEFKEGSRSLTEGHWDQWISWKSGV